MNLDQLKHWLIYYPKTGVFVWLRSPNRRIMAGTRAGFLRGGRRYISILGRAYADYHLAWLYMTGELPKETIDHRNRDPLDCTWLNLREATIEQQAFNKKVRKDNALGLKGVTKMGKRYRSRIQAGGKVRILGYFDTAEAAAEAYRVAAQELHGEFYSAA